MPQATFTLDQVIAMQRATLTATGGAAARPLPRLDPMVPFGPGIPLVPAPINPVRPDSGRAEPRQWEYDVAWNLPGFGQRLVPWKVLRDAAEFSPIARRCIEIRKSEVATLDWDIVISAKAIERAQRQAGDGTSRQDVEKAMRERVDSHVGRLVDFWECPDRWNGHDFISWASKVLEEYFVLDAIAIYPRYTLGGDLFGFEVLDGTSIKPLLDTSGRRPLPPQPAYQQIMHGFPRGEFVADFDPSSPPKEVYGADQLVYRVHNVRSFTPYGYSAVEQALPDIELLMRRDAWLKAEYTDGVMPSGWLTIPETQLDLWSPQLVAEYERSLNDLYSGNTAERMRFRMLPPGVLPHDSKDNNERYKADYDLYLIKRVAGHLDTTIAELGYTEQGGLGSTGWHEGQADVQDRKATQPTLRRLQALCTSLMRRFLGAPPELEFKILGLESEDEQAAEDVAKSRMERAGMTLNEDRDRTGLPRYTFPEADMPMVVTGRGVVFLEGASKLAPPGQLIGPAKPVEDPNAVAGEAQSEDGQDGGGQQQQPARPQTVNKADAAVVKPILLDDYPADALDWMDGFDWTLKDVPLTDIDFSGAATWQASREPDKVAKFARKITKGRMNPVILVRKPGADKYTVIDGHHRSLAAKKLGVSVRSWVADVDAKTGPWDRMHRLQFHGHGNDDTTRDTGKADAATELAAYRRWLAKGRTARPFRFVYLSKADASAAGVDLTKAEFGEAAPSGRPKSSALARLGAGPGGGRALGTDSSGRFDWGELRRLLG